MILKSVCGCSFFIDVFKMACELYVSCVLLIINSLKWDDLDKLEKRKQLLFLANLVKNPYPGAFMNDEYLTLKDFCSRYGSIVSIGSLRWILFNSKFNGADSFVRRIGKRKLLISTQRFFSWVESNKRGEVK